LKSGVKFGKTPPIVFPEPSIKDLESAMKVDLMSEIQIGTPPAGATKAVERPASGNTAGTSRSSASADPSTVRNAGNTSSTTVTLSPQSQALAGSGDVIDMSKVETMRAAIQNGTFKVNPEAIADKLLSNAKEMLTASRR
jgi:negative regulator of flagellin synthesis FlgM